MRNHNQKDSLYAAYQQMKEMFSGAAIRSVAGIQQLGEIALATIGDSTSNTHEVHEKKRDVWVRFTDALSGLTEIGRLYAPAGILWRAAAKGDGAHVIRGRKMRGPGASLVMPDGGDGKTDNVVPPWFPDDSGIYDPAKNVHVESVKDTVTIKVGDATIVVDKNNGIAITAAAGQTVNVNGSDYSLPKLETLLADFATNWNLLVGVLGAGTQGTPVAQTLTGLAAVLAQLTQFGSNLAGAAYKSTKAKNG